jgi:CelD/BcsL family acetyltransferase involved in cellulose biosynthesis
VKALDLYNLMESSPTQNALRDACAQIGWSFSTARLMPAPHIPLAESFEAYLATLDKKQRHEIRRKLRNAQARHQTTWYTVTEKDALTAEMDAFIAMMHNDHRKVEFLQTPAMRQYLHDFAKAAFEDGLLRLSFLTFDNRKAAAFLSVVTPQKLWVYNSAWEPAFGSSSPGWVLLAKEIDWAIAYGIHEVDMMRGDEDYKYKFGAIDRFIMHTRCTPQ